MLIDWFTVGAQVLNFVVLVWLLKRFLYRPVLDAIDAREARIAQQIAAATATQASALRKEQDFERRNEDFDARRDTLLKQATVAADSERQRLVAAAREAADAVAMQRQDADRHDASNLGRALADRTRAEVFAIARRVLVDLADTPLDERIAAVFLQRLHALEPDALTALASGLDKNHPRAIVRSAFEPGVAQREILRTAVVAALAPRQKEATPALDVVFETASDLLGGVELVVGGRKLAWNVDQYMDALEQVLAPALPATKTDEHAVPARSAAAVPEAAT